MNVSTAYFQEKRRGLMKHSSLVCLAVAIGISAVGEADEIDDIDRDIRRP